MAGPPEVIAWKYANLFSPDAEMSKGARRTLFWDSGSSVDWLRQRMGGLWIGGAVTLTRDHLFFGPNALNVAAHADDTSHGVELARVAEVADRFGWLTRIIDVKTDDGEIFTFRCFGARAFADQIRHTVESVRR